jgi:hypothetical protein
MPRAFRKETGIGRRQGTTPRSPPEKVVEGEKRLPANPTDPERLAVPPRAPLKLNDMACCPFFAKGQLRASSSAFSGIAQAA